MYTLLRLLPVERLAYEQVPTVTLAWVIAELFFKFQSFTLECAAFLATWFMLDALFQKVVRPLFTRQGEEYHESDSSNQHKEPRRDSWQSFLSRHGCSRRSAI